MQQPVVVEAPPMMTYGDWGYLALAFIIFSVSLAIVRRQFAHLAERSDVKKALKGKLL